MDSMGCLSVGRLEGNGVRRVVANPKLSIGSYRPQHEIDEREHTLGKPHGFLGLVDGLGEERLH